MEERRLFPKLFEVSRLKEPQQKVMFEIFRRYFESADWESFLLDLGEKEWALVLHEPSRGAICGFSTLMRTRFDIDGAPVQVFFSGDTIIEREYWGSFEMMRAWGTHVFLKAEEEAETTSYWFLISSGYRTYRFLPTFFCDFYPRHDRLDNRLKRILDAVAEQQFAGRYDPATGIVQLHNPTPLRSGVSEITDTRLIDPHVSFFVERNPGHWKGDELACIAEISRSNLTSAGTRMLQRR